MSLSILVLLLWPHRRLTQPTADWSKEVVYQIFERSFYSSSGDHRGDFKGIQEKLPYISSLGATAILLQPIFKSPFYHNYFADSFTEADPSLGGTGEFFALVKAAHRKHLKVILDMEPQYVASGHPWFKQGAPRTLGKGIYGMNEVPVYSGAKVKLDTVNLHDPANVSELHRVFKFWAAPDGNPQDGVDGFRIDHMMDDLDNLHLNTNLLEGFWAPLESDLRTVKPSLFFVAEQADWKSLGEPLFQTAHVDAVYAIPLSISFSAALEKQDTTHLNEAIRSELKATPPGKTQLLVIEDHDMERFASRVGNDPRILRLGAFFQLVLKGTPSIYYGQELGMRGVQLKGHSDGNDIPIRLAMRWQKSEKEKGTADWYGKGAWSESRESRANGSISVEQEERDPNSLLNFYRDFLRLRASSSPLTAGSETTVGFKSKKVLGIYRKTERQTLLAVLNFSDKTVKTSPVAPIGNRLERVIGEGALMKDTLTLPPYGFALLRALP